MYQILNLYKSVDILNLFGICLYQIREVISRQQSLKFQEEMG